MATVGTSTQADLLSPPTIAGVARDPSGDATIGGYLYAVIRTAADTLTVYRSTNAGSSWASWSNFTHVGLQEWSRFFVDKYGYGHLGYRVGTGSADTLWYKRVSLTTASWSTALQVSNTDANAGSIGSRWQGVDIAVVRNSNGTYAIVVGGAHTYTPTGPYGIILQGVSIDATGRIYLNNGIILNSRGWNVTGTPPGRSGIAMEIEHNGDGVTSSTPHLWVTWGRARINMVKLAWQGTTVGWSGPSSFQVIRSTITAQNYAGGRWDGKQWLMSVVNPDDSTSVRIYQRNQANTATTTYDSPTHPTGNVTNIATSYDNVTKDIRVFAVGTSTAVLYYCDYTRATGVWTAWATVVATAVLSSTEWTVRSGGSSGDSKHHVLTTASGSPNTVTETAQSASSVPNIAVWNTSSLAYLNGGAADVGASLTLKWDFSDPDPGQVQGSYALSRQIGAGTVSYWNASTVTWGASEVQNSTATQQVVLASGWASGTDANYTFKVKVWDNTNVPAVGYSAAMVLIPSVKVNPTLTAPSGTPTISTDKVTATWTVAEQTQYRVRLFSPGSVLLYTSGDVTDSTTTSFTIPYSIPNGSTGWTVELRTKNNEGLVSTSQLGNFNVSFAQPPATISTYAPSTTNGYIAVSGSALAPVGTQPSITTADLYRRVATTPPINSNPTFAGNVTGWKIGGGGTAGTLTYSTTQFHEGPGAARFVPNAAGPTAPQVESLTPVTIDPTQVYYASGWIRPDTASKPIFILVGWYDASSVFISNSIVGSIAAPVAGAWHFLEVVADPTGVTGAAKATVAIGESSTPVAVDAFYADEVKLELYIADAGIRVATGLLPPVTFNDWGAAGSTEYEYRWFVSGSNGTTITGPWVQ